MRMIVKRPETVVVSGLLVLLEVIAVTKQIGVNPPIFT